MKNITMKIENEEMFDTRVREFIEKLSSRIGALCVIFMIAGVLQIVLGVLSNYVFSLMGLLNVVISAKLMLFSRDMFKYTGDIISRLKSAPFCLFVIILGTVSGLVPALYYVVFIRLFLFKKRRYFSVFD